ncbi:MAG: sigma-54 dependent transcriptional regulator [Deltaproteobacteria bacterium]|nr:sigma-54 dependent transcriptional regulator [Deltaproteobacteria bacterium]
MVPCLAILHHGDMARVGEVALLTALAADREVALSRLEPVFAPLRKGASLPLGDPHLSRQPIWLKPLEGGGVRVDGCDAGTPLRVGGLALEGPLDISLEELGKGVVLSLAQRVLLYLHFVDPLPPQEVPQFDLVGQSSQMAEVREEIQRVACRSIPVLVRGPTGSGKELVAQAIHRTGPRSSGPFVSVNMAAIPPSLAAAELFGVVPGAFTGADRRRSGFFQQAHGGTLFLDEVGETPREIQALLLRALDEKEIRPVGGDVTRKVNVRVLAATDLDLEEAILGKNFLGPLFHRLAGYEIFLPPLKNRRQDIPLLLGHFLRQELEAMGCAHRLEARAAGASCWLPASLMERFLAYSWPGNVRQLRNLAQRLAVAFGDAEKIGTGWRLKRLLASTLGEKSSGRPLAAAHNSTQQSTPQPSQIEESELREVLRNHRWSLKPTAEALGISRTSLYGLLEKFPGIRPAAKLGAQEIHVALENHDRDVTAAALELEVSKQGLLQRLRELEIK